MEGVARSRDFTMSEEYDSDETVVGPDDGIPPACTHSPSILDNSIGSISHGPESSSPAAADKIYSVQQEQSAIESQLLSNNFEVGFIRLKLSAIGDKIKQISAENQNERKMLAAKCSLNNRSQDGGRSNKLIKSQLINLAERQKALLASMSKHKELIKKLSDITTSGRADDAGRIISNNGSQRNDTFKTTSSASTTAGHVHNSAVSKPKEHVPHSRSADHHVSECKVKTTLLQQPVPLESLMKCNLLSTNDKFSCNLLSCHFESFLTCDGQLMDVNGKIHPSPHQWLMHCWSILGHHYKKINRRQAYKIVMAKDVALLSICEEYNRQQITNYHKKSQSSNILPNSQPTVSSQSVLPNSQLTNNQSVLPNSQLTNSQSVLPNSQPTVSNQSVLPNSQLTNSQSVLPNSQPTVSNQSVLPNSQLTNSQSVLPNSQPTVSNQSVLPNSQPTVSNQSVLFNSQLTNSQSVLPNSQPTVSNQSVLPNSQLTNSQSTNNSQHAAGSQPSSSRPIITKAHHHAHFNINHILTQGRVLHHQTPTTVTSLPLPENFWDTGIAIQIPVNISQTIIEDLNWT